MIRTHTEIIKAHDGPGKVAALVHGEIGGDAEVIRKRVNSWSANNSIPGEYWPLIERLGLATLDELAAAAEARKFPELAAREAAA